MTVERQQIVDLARTYLGVRWHHQGRCRAGLDCAGLVIVVGQELGLTSFDSYNYGRLPNGMLMEETLSREMTRVFNPQIGDVLLFRFEIEAQHVAIVTDRGIIHAYTQSRKVVEHSLDDIWRSRIVGVYSFKGL